MIKLLIFILSINILIANGTQEYKRINGIRFKITKESYDEYGDKGITLKFFKSKEKHSSLTFNLENQSGSCSNKSIQESSYEINASTIIFYTNWRRKGRAYDSPIGDRIQVYNVSKDGIIKQISGRVYIEKTRKTYDSEEGMNYLFIPAKTIKEKQELQNYIESVERIFKASFVFAKEKEKLYQEVYNALRRKHKKKWH